MGWDGVGGVRGPSGAKRSLSAVASELRGGKRVSERPSVAA